MRSYTLLVAAFAAVAVAQSSTPTAAAPAPSATLSETQKCLKKCDVDDISCQADCAVVPSPNEEQIAETLKCSMDCDQGKGSPEETEAYGQCLKACSDKYYFIPGQGSPNDPNAPSKGDDVKSSATAAASSVTSKAAAAVTDAASSVTEAVSSATDGAESVISSIRTRASSAVSSAASSTASEAAQETSPDSGAAPLMISSFGIVGVIAAIFM